MYCSQGYVQQIPQVRYNLASNLFLAQSDSRTFFEILNFYFTKTDNISVYGNTAAYIKYCAVCLKIDYTLSCLEYLFSIFTATTPRDLAALTPLCLLIETLTHVF